MPGDGIVRIGAEFDKTNVDAGLGDTQEMVKATMASITTTITEAGAKTKAAWKGLSDEVKAGAEAVSAEALKVAESSRAVAAAQADVRRAVVLTRDAAIPASESMAVLASAQTRLAAAQAAAGEAAQAQAAATVEGAEEVALSSNAIVAGFERAQMAVATSLESMRERLVMTGQGMNLSMRDWIPQFAGMGELLGAALLAGFTVHFIDGIAKTNVELEHLRTETGIAVTSLAGLQEIVKEAGLEWEPMERALVMFQKNMVEVSQNQIEYVRAVNAVGLSWDDLKGHTPEQQLAIVSKAFADTANEERVAYAAKELFGRGGAELIPILKEQGAQLEQNMRQTGALTGITDESAAAARRWTADTARLSTEFKSLLMPVMEHAEEAARVVAGAFEILAATVVSALEAVATAIVATYAPMFRLGVLMKDAVTGNWGAIKSDAEQMSTAFADTWKAGFAEIKADWAEVGHTLTAPAPMPELPKGIDLGDMEPPEKKPKAAKERLGRAAKGDVSATATASLAAPPDTQSADTSGADAEMIAGLRAQVKATQDAAKEETQAYRDAAEEKIRLANESYAETERNTEFEVRMGTLSPQQRTEALREAAQQQQQIVAQLYQYIEMLDMGNAREHSRDLQAEIQSWQQWATRITEINREAATKMQQRFQDMFQSITGPLNTFVDYWLTNGQRMAVSFQRMYDQMAMTAINSLLKIGEKWAAHEALLTAAHAAGLATRSSADAGAQALSNTRLAAELAKWIAMEWAKVTHHTAANAAKSASDVAAATASTAAATGAAAVHAAIDVSVATSSVGAGAAAAGAAVAAASGPAAPVAGPAAAAAFAAAMSPYIAMAAFDAGGIMGHGRMGINLSGADERVLSPSQTENFERLVNQKQTTTSSSSEVHFHDHSSFTGIDGASVEGMYRRNSQAARREMMRQLRLANAI